MVVNLSYIKIRFDNAQRALLANLADSDEGSPAYIQLALDQMNQAFNELVIATLLNEPTQSDPIKQHELLCAYAINMGDTWDGSCWHVAYINGEPLSSGPSVSDFTRQMLLAGWKTTTLPTRSARWEMPSGVDVIPLYFCREKAQTVSGMKRIELVDLTWSLN